MLHGWENFFIVGATTGATLIGLLFVAITLGAGLSTPQGLDATRAFLTPTLIRFGGVLFECMAVLPPWPSAWPVGIILGLFGDGPGLSDELKTSTSGAGLRNCCGAKTTLLARLYGPAARGRRRVGKIADVKAAPPFEHVVRVANFCGQFGGPGRSPRRP